MPGIPSTPPSAAWQEAWQSYELLLISLERSQCTIRNKRSEVAVMSRYFTSIGLDPADVTKASLTKYLVSSYQGRKPGGKVAHHQAAKSFWSWYAEEYGTPSPAEGIQRPKGASEAVPIVKPEDFGAVLKACEDKTAKLTKRNEAMVWLMVESGLRRFEVTALDVSDMDLKARTVMVRNGKGGKARLSVFGPDTALALMRWLRLRGHEDGPLFTSHMGGGALTPGGLTQVLKRVKRRSGVEVRPHMMRHTWAHLSLAAGVQEHDLMTLAGWSSTSMLGRYGAVAAQDRAIAAGHAAAVGKAMKQG